MAFATAHAGPMGEMNTTPLIDVMLVLLVMVILTIPIANHSLDFDLPAPPVEGATPPPINPIKNKIVLTPDGAILWNGGAMSEGSLAQTLQASRTAYAREPELQFEPQAMASYDLSARVLKIIKASGVSNFGFVGNERYRQFGSPD
ncbi:MAG: biopolymer transporter ExbD [Proteobacteria bacterium]|nr:MAG: biopolymer transporter ExbD [Pseudomonadota bacterium]